MKKWIAEHPDKWREYQRKGNEKQMENWKKKRLPVLELIEEIFDI